MKNTSGFNIIEGLALLVIIAVFAGMIALVALGVKGCNHVRKKGIKNVVTGVWEGSEAEAHTNPPASNNP